MGQWEHLAQRLKGGPGCQERVSGRESIAQLGTAQGMGGTM